MASDGHATMVYFCRGVLAQLFVSYRY